MGVADLLSAFNMAGAPGFTAAKATMQYQKGGGVQYQILTFWGIKQDGSAFTAKSEWIRPGADLNAAAADMARGLLTKGTA